MLTLTFRSSTRHVAKTRSAGMSITMGSPLVRHPLVYIPRDPCTTKVGESFGVHVFVPPSRCFPSRRRFDWCAHIHSWRTVLWLSCLGDQMYGMTITVPAPYGKPPVFVRRPLGETPVIQLAKDKKTLSST